MHNKFLTDDMNALCNAIIAGEAKPDIDEFGYEQYTMGGAYLSATSWHSALDAAKETLQSKPSFIGYQNTNGFYWIHATIDGRKSIGCTYSLNGKSWYKQRNFKFPARVALEDLRARLDRGAI